MSGEGIERYLEVFGEVLAELTGSHAATRRR
jgi:hypothetical protein